MSSRQEEKQRLRAEREAREQAQAGKASNRRRLQLVAAALLGIVAIGAVIAAIVSSTGGGDSNANSSDGIASVSIPPQKITNLDAAAKAAGCTWKQWPDEGHTHIPDTQSFNGYKTNPPTSGTHRITPAQEGIYDPGNSPNINNAVHAMEHGRIEIQYKPGTPKREIGQLETLFNEKVKGVPGYHELLFQNTTHMPYAVAATAWTRSLTCPQFNDKVFDAIRAFRERFIDKGREMIP